MNKNKAEAGDEVVVRTNKGEEKGTLLESHESGILLLKLNSGYNIGIKKRDVEKIDILQKRKEEKETEEKRKFQREKPTISVLHTGGTIASSIDYRTGAVKPRITDKEFASRFSEIYKKTNVRTRMVLQMFSEDMEPEHWIILAKEIAKEMKKGVEGIIVTHGTDTMHYTSAALSFMLQNLGIPVLLVGAQRSPDRGSNDSYLNMECAVKFILETDFSGVAICMHGSTSDDFCYIHQGNKVRKMHSSRRDAFQSINVKPIAKVYPDKIEFLRKDYKKKDKGRKLKLDSVFNKNIVLVKVHPGFSSHELKLYKQFKGIIFEGTGLGHLPATVLDKHTKDHSKILKILKEFSKNKVMFMTTQTLFGRVDMNVYSSGRDLMKSGVIPLEDMLAERAFVKLGWLLGHKNKGIEIVKQDMLKNIAGEFNPRLGAEFLE